MILIFLLLLKLMRAVSIVKYYCSDLSSSALLTSSNSADFWKVFITLFNFLFNLFLKFYFFKFTKYFQ